MNILLLLLFLFPQTETETALSSKDNAEMCMFVCVWARHLQLVNLQDPRRNNGANGIEISVIILPLSLCSGPHLCLCLRGCLLAVCIQVCVCLCAYIK